MIPLTAATYANCACVTKKTMSSLYESGRPASRYADFTTSCATVITIGSYVGTISSV